MKSISPGLLISNLIAVALVISCLKWKSFGRGFYFVLFLGASIANGYTSIFKPQGYLSFAKLTFFQFYKDFITGFFSEHITLIVLGIAICQFLIALSMLFKGNILKLGSAGGIIFLVSIAPLGIGSAFPFTLILAIGLYFIIRKI